MAQVAPASRQNLSLTAFIRSGWERFIRGTNHTMAKGLYGEDIAFSDTIERELMRRELHPDGY